VLIFLFELVSLGSGGGRIDEWCGGGVDGGGGLAFMSNGGALDKAGVRHGIGVGVLVLVRFCEL
jgi:hypothetical protein